MKTTTIYSLFLLIQYDMSENFSRSLNEYKVTTTKCVYSKNRQKHFNE